jgi:Ca2+-binding EF-hand superfamily protein
LSEEKLRFIFKFFDEFNDDYITPKLIINVMKQNDLHFDEKEVLKIFNGNDSQKLDFETFKKLMNDEVSASSTSTYF